MQTDRFFKKVSDGISIMLLGFSFLPFLFFNRLKDIRLPRQFGSIGGECGSCESLWVFLLFAFLSVSTYLFIARIVEYDEKKVDELNGKGRLTDIKRIKMHILRIKFIESMGVLILAIFSWSSVSCLLYAFGLTIMEEAVIWGIGIIMALIVTAILCFIFKCARVKY